MALGQAGAAVAAHYHRSADGAEEVVAAARAAGGRALTVQADVAQAAQVHAMIDAVIAEWGRLDILVCNAGLMDREPFLEMTDDLWRRVIETNLYGTFICAQAAARQ
mgnify:CR=1 FL=1